MRKFKALSLLFIPISLAISCLSFNANNVVVKADEAVNGFINNNGSSANFSALADGGVSLDMKYGDNFRYEEVITEDYVDFYVEFITSDVRFTFIVDDNNNNHQDWIIMQKYWGGVNFQTMSYWNDPGHDNSVGYQHFHLDFTNEGTKYYYNGYYITKTEVKKSAYASGAKLVFQLETNANFLAKIRVGKAGFTDSRKTTIKDSGLNVTYGFNFNHATITSLLLYGNTNHSIPTEKYTLNENNIVIDGGYIKDSIEFGTYEFRACFGEDYDTSVLIVAEKAEMELVSDSFEFDKYFDDQVNVPIYQNGDSFTQVTGNDIQSGDYSFDSQNEIVIITKTYLSSLEVGLYTFKVHSTAVVAGIEFSIQINDSTPPICINNVKEYDVYLNNNVTFDFELRQNAFISLEGNDIQSGDYEFNNSTLTIKGLFLSKFTPLTSVEFTAGFTYGSTQLTINIISTEKAEILQNSQRININSIIDAEYSVNIKYDVITTLSGNSISASDWYFDADRNLIVIKSSFISLFSVGEYQFNGVSKNGLEFELTLVIFDSTAPELLSSASLDFEKTTADEQVVKFTINPHDGNFLYVLENKNVIDGYSLSEVEGNDVITFNKAFLLSLTNGEHNFVISFDNGVVNATLNITNAASPYYLDNQEIKYDVVPNGNYQVKFINNNGVFDKVLGNSITSDDYEYDYENNQLTIKSDYLDSVNSHEVSDFTVSFDNGNLSLHVTREVMDNFEDAFIPMYTWEEPAGSVFLSSLDDGWVDVNYVRPKTGDFAGGVKVRELLDVTRPITFYVDFVSVPDLAGSNFALTLSNKDYQMYYNNGFGCAEAFGVFSVGATYLKTAYFGRPGIDAEPDRQIPHEFLKRSELGYETITFDIGEESTKIYLNGTLIRETLEVTRSCFDNGLAYGLFTPHFWHDQEGTEFKIKLENNAKSLNDSLILNTKSLNTVDVNAYIGSAVVRNVYLSNDIDLLPLNGYHVNYNYSKGTARILIPANAILHREGYNASFNKIAIKTDKMIYVPLRISENQSIDLYTNTKIFNVCEPNDVNFDYLRNEDGIISISGNGISQIDYGISNSVFFIKKDFLSTLDLGEHEFTVNTNLTSEKIYIKVVDSTPPQISTETQDFDINTPTNLTYQFTAPVHEKMELVGNNITDADYVINDNNFTINSSFLQTLRVGSYSFILRSYYTNDLYSESTFDVRIINSIKPSFNGLDTISLEYTSGSKEQISINVTENNGKLITIDGGYITADDYKNDNGTITFYGHWLETLPNGNTTLILKYDNGTLTININKLEPAPNIVKPSSNNYVALYIVLGCSAAFCLGSALAFVLLRRRKKHEKTM